MESEELNLNICSRASCRELAKNTILTLDGLRPILNSHASLIESCIGTLEYCCNQLDALDVVIQDHLILDDDSDDYEKDVEECSDQRESITYNILKYRRILTSIHSSQRVLVDHDDSATDCKCPSCDEFPFVTHFKKHFTWFMSGPVPPLPQVKCKPPTATPSTCLHEGVAPLKFNFVTPVHSVLPSGRVAVGNSTSAMVTYPILATKVDTSVDSAMALPDGVAACNATSKVIPSADGVAPF